VPLRETGRADGRSSFQVRTLEILDSFGIGERVWKESNHMIEVCFWNPDENGQIRRENRVVNGLPGLSRFSEVVLHQGRMETFFLDAINASYAPPGRPDDGAQGVKHVGEAGDGDAGVDEPRPIEVERMVIPTELTIDEDAAEDEDAYPVTVTLRHLTEEEATPTQMLSNLRDGLFRSNLADDDVGEILRKSEGRQEARQEVVRCKYVVGCDGAHSWTRKTLGKEFEMVGEMTDFIW